MFRLNEGGTAIVSRSQIVTGSQRHRHPCCLLALRAPSELSTSTTFKLTEDTFGSQPFLQNLTHTTAEGKRTQWQP